MLVHVAPAVFSNVPQVVAVTRAVVTATNAPLGARVPTLQVRIFVVPLMVVEGIGHDTGRERAGIERLLAEAQRRTTRRATPELSRTQDGALTVKLTAFPLEGGPADVTLAIYDRRHSTPVA